MFPLMNVQIQGKKREAKCIQKSSTRKRKRVLGEENAADDDYDNDISTTTLNVVSFADRVTQKRGDLDIRYFLHCTEDDPSILSKR